MSSSSGLHERYAREGITIPFPIRTVIARNEVARA
jgi:small-conductance mechanosensitive channel